MASRLDALPAALADQCRHQLGLDRARAGRLIPAVFAAGLAVSVLGLVPTLVWFAQDGSPWLRLGLFAAATAFFGFAVGADLTRSRRLAPRIVPYFPRRLGEPGGPASSAFRRGMALVQHLVVLDGLAGELRVAPLSSFGFADDHYDQPVRWHSVADGLTTVEALRLALDARAPAASDAAADLAALATALRTAAGHNVAFSLVLRLHARDSVQAVSLWEPRQGSFW